MIVIVVNSDYWALLLIMSAIPGSVLQPTKRVVLISSRVQTSAVSAWSICATTTMIAGTTLMR